MASGPEQQWAVWADGDEPADGYVFPTTLLDYAEEAAELAAERYYSDCGEWHTGTQDFRVRSPDGMETVWRVEIDYNPFFTAWEKAPPAAKSGVPSGSREPVNGNGE